jgi:hypothetical protein
MVDVPRELVQYVARLLRAERRARRTRKKTRALTCFYQALLVLIWFRKQEDLTQLGAGFGISRATAYRYRDEGIAVLAAQAQDLYTAPKRVADDGWSYVILDGKLFHCDRLTETTLSTKGETIDGWYSGKNRDLGANIQAIMRPDGLPIWTSAAMPGHLHDSSCARELGVTAAMNWSAAELHLPALADFGYESTGQGIKPRSSNRPTASSSRSTTAPTTGSCARPALARRTRLRHPHRPLESPAPQHNQPTPDRRHRRGSATPDPFRIQIPTRISLKISSLYEVSRAESAITDALDTPGQRMGSHPVAETECIPREDVRFPAPLFLRSMAIIVLRSMAIIGSGSAIFRDYLGREV